MCKIQEKYHQDYFARYAYNHGNIEVFMKSHDVRIIGSPKEFRRRFLEGQSFREKDVKE